LHPSFFSTCIGARFDFGVHSPCKFIKQELDREREREERGRQEREGETRERGREEMEREGGREGEVRGEWEIQVRVVIDSRTRPFINWRLCMSDANIKQ
jgi:hypothetical protein